MLYELRIYDVVPGQMQALLDRFQYHTIRLFAEHDMKITDFWVDADESANRLYYIVEHRDLASRESNFKHFMEDPEWLALVEKTEANGPLHEKIEVIYLNKAPFMK
ncbi:NIPSNAP family protein [Paenibacillus glycanilyticus]|uniref:NIPSNAP family protein n=1 Tax=Paenibacillus glycanilyticus TaxID=126569 RepID=UPI00203D71AD|nr:NIPSNAP family protein [Paenibacillus glycanilyticus]MCM3628337.1 NIPSNAP family protein [Paenibacillus glycanilyticus]